ncbi:uncharacterized protein LOC127264979 [Andrographis paniculata]|uniref:uncharacterized protein LOC127264979 n=1 Tax=Andrographis paniculata TaxID=175694 RepID=UPI0021E9401E|nr:uncharacterized protein LOC127264979 [Andrographis paniculata]
MASSDAGDSSEEEFGRLLKRSRLNDAQSLEDLVKFLVEQGNASAAPSSTAATVDNTSTASVSASTSTANNKLEASTFPATLLKISVWKYVPRNEHDLEVKFDFTGRKILWELLKDGLKYRREVLWDDIIGLKGDFPENGPDSLIVVVDKQPKWQPNSNSTTDEQESLRVKHYLEFSHGVLKEHFKKLIKCDARLAHLSLQPELVRD